MREKAVTCFTSAAEHMSAPAGFMTSPAFSNLRWTLAGDQRDERVRVFARKLLKRLDGMQMPFFPEVGLMNLPTARHRYVTGLDPWTPAESPFLDGVMVRFRHCVHRELPAKCWELFGEIGFDVARLAQIPMMWGGAKVADIHPGDWMVYDKVEPAGWIADKRTYGVRGV